MSKREQQVKANLGAGGVAPGAGHDIAIEEPMQPSPLSAPGIGESMGWDRGKNEDLRTRRRRNKNPVTIEILRNRSS